MDKIDKALRKFSEKEKRMIKEILERIESQNLDNLDVKKLKTREDIFRVRKGKIRVIFRKTEKETLVLTIERRSEKTYRNI